MKYGRQNVILKIISDKSIETQNQLMQELAARGIKSTQATLSRDIQDMRLIKQLGQDGKYRYAQSVSQDGADSEQKLKKIFKEGIISYEVAQNLLIIKTLPGVASAACSAIDAMHIDGLVGSLAGDDTAFLAMKNEAAAVQLHEQIDKLF